MNLKEMINEMYESESLDAVLRAETKAVNIAIPVGTFALLRVIADRFEKSLSSIGSDVLTDACNEMWYYLSDEDKEELSKKADDLAHETLLSQGMVLTPPYDKWISQYKTFLNNSEEKSGGKSE